ncbi:MerR family transcriptional regulator [Streptomyces spiramenti]|uniref:MerR family transcriptional regulator n=1 Tax=Streptomyces spiramenti TaxID=2720606 RepID=A0ABX1AKK1_9ACTN|nr:MerR family transcriptional regulator [Streptomyces spiramenti]NJP67642.1 MerR family transcriptional regulator [Streptomyces spiramenti]
MRIGELSRRTGVPVATIKYYLREGLLPPGESTGRNQAVYDDGHARRLRLARALITVGGLSVVAAREVLEALAVPDRSTYGALAVAHKSVTRHDPDPAVPEEARQRAAERVRRLIADRGWELPHDHPAARTLTDTLATMEHLGNGSFAARLDRFAAASEQIAAADVDCVDEIRDSPEEMAETMIVGTVLGDTALSALRRLAQQDAARRRFAPASRPGPAAGPDLPQKPEGPDRTAVARPEAVRPDVDPTDNG